MNDMMHFLSFRVKKNVKSLKCLMMMIMMMMMMMMMMMIDDDDADE